MKLLFDQNISDRLLDLLSDTYPGSLHVRRIGLATADDEQVWNYAAQYNLTIVSKDSDFRQRSFLFGPPPKVVSIAFGNCSTGEIERALRARRIELEEFARSTESALLVISSLVHRF